MRINKILRNIVILISPFLLMIIVNESMRYSIKEKPYSIYGITAINSAEKINNRCTWIAHSNTGFCKENHVKYLKPYFKYTDPFYFGIISMLHKTGNYGLANIIFLVILFPFMIWFFIIKSMNIQDEINKLNSRDNE